MLSCPSSGGTEPFLSGSLVAFFFFHLHQNVNAPRANRSRVPPTAPTTAPIHPLEEELAGRSSAWVEVLTVAVLDGIDADANDAGVATTLDAADAEADDARMDVALTKLVDEVVDAGISRYIVSATHKELAQKSCDQLLLADGNSSTIVNVIQVVKPSGL